MEEHRGAHIRATPRDQHGMLDNALVAYKLE